MEKTDKILSFFPRSLPALILVGMICFAGCDSGNNASQVRHKDSSSRNRIQAQDRAPVQDLDREQSVSSDPPLSPSSASAPLSFGNYDLQNMPDPFVPLTSCAAISGIQETSSLETAFVSEPKTSDSVSLLETLDMDSLRLTAIVFTRNQKIALLEESDGKGHEVRTGTWVGKNKGRVTQILRDGILIRESRQDGTHQTRKITLRKNTEE